jgi:hypothetical protein
VIPARAVKIEALANMTRGWLASGIEAFAEMMENDARTACGRHARARTEGRVAGVGRKVEIERPWLRRQGPGSSQLGRGGERSQRSVPMPQAPSKRLAPPSPAPKPPNQLVEATRAGAGKVTRYPFLQTRRRQRDETVNSPHPIPSGR